MQMDGYESDDDYEVDEDRISAQEEVERAEVDSQKLDEELLHAERTPTPGCNVTRLPCTAHKVRSTSQPIKTELTNIIIMFNGDTTLIIY